MRYGGHCCYLLLFLLPRTAKSQPSVMPLIGQRGFGVGVMSTPFVLACSLQRLEHVFVIIVDRHLFKSVLVWMLFFLKNKEEILHF